MKQRNWFLSCLVPLTFLGMMICWPNGIHASEDSGKALASGPAIDAPSDTGEVDSSGNSTIKERTADVKTVQKAAGNNSLQTEPTKAKSAATEPLKAGAETNGRIVRKKMDEASFFNAQIHDLAVQLIKNFNGDSGPGSPVAVSTFVDLNNLHKTSPFGRYLAEQLMGELQRAGFRVIEVRKTDSILVKERYGEYGLSRDVGEISNEASAQLVLVGTYITRGKYILINARLVSNRENMLASSAMKILNRDRFLDRMLWPTMAPDTSPTVKIPIKEFGQPSEVKIISGS